MKNCTDCILDGTDACQRGAGRAVDDEVCECFVDDKKTEVDFSSMTNDEAIEILKVAKSTIEWEYPMDYQIVLDKAIKALEQNPYKDFCEFVAKMVLRDDFEENAGANAEFLCRKLSKLGIVKANEDEWVLAESRLEK